MSSSISALPGRFSLSSRRLVRLVMDSELSWNPKTAEISRQCASVRCFELSALIIGTLGAKRSNCAWIESANLCGSEASAAWSFSTRASKVLDISACADAASSPSKARMGPLTHVEKTRWNCSAVAHNCSYGSSSAKMSDKLKNVTFSSPSFVSSALNNCASSAARSTPRRTSRSCSMYSRIIFGLPRSENADTAFATFDNSTASAALRFARSASTERLASASCFGPFATWSRTSATA
mmetsp:Transcript_11346/g.37896  ORF Transcript_11346/g.37896 Transcript_11346/m.37896 type:complete len:238 (+) Transcript_11346:201-914(+)